MPGEFTITELRSTGVGSTKPPVKFVWTAANRAAPRGSWRFGLEQRTIREDYPGAAEPVEQVLGANFKEFTLNGCWDDRYNEAGFAKETWQKFEELVARGSLVRIEFESISITGILKDAEFDYKRADYIMYQFTVSPHYRTPGDLAAAGGGRKKTPAAFRPVTEFRDLVNTQRDALNQIAAAGPYNQMTGDQGATAKARVADIDTSTTGLVDTIATRVVNGVEKIDGLRRIAASFNVLKGYAAALMTDLATAKSSTAMAWDSAAGILEWEVWTRGLEEYARLLFRTSHEAEVEMSRRVAPKAIAIYYPHRGESLYSVSQRFYGTPSNWRLIADRNNLETMTLQGTEALIIPERS
jgi:hypothetical protein